MNDHGTPIPSDGNTTGFLTRTGVTFLVILLGMLLIQLGHRVDDLVRWMIGG